MRLIIICVLIISTALNIFGQKLGMIKERRCAFLFPGRRRIASEPLKESDTVAVLRVKLHCPACVSDVTRCLQSSHGVMEVIVDAKTEIITVKGRQLDPSKLCEGLLRKTRKRCEVLLFSTIEDLMRHHHELLTNTMPQVQQHDMSLANTMPVPTTTTIDGTTLGGPQPISQVAYPQDVSPNLALVPIEHISTSVDPPNLSTPFINHHAIVPTRPLQEVHEPRVEINQQTHTVIYGWPSQYQAHPQYWMGSNPYYVHDRDFRYGEIFSEENPNACNIM